MVTFIDQHRATYAVEPICAVLPIAPSTYFVHKAQQAAWTIQQFQNGIPLDGAHRSVVHDRDSVFALRHPATDRFVMNER